MPKTERSPPYLFIHLMYVHKYNVDMNMYIYT